MIPLRHPSTKDIALALNLKPTLQGYTGACPNCNYPSGFTLNEKHGKPLFYCHAGGCSWAEIRLALRFLAYYEPPNGLLTSAPTSPSKDDLHMTRLVYVQKLWCESQDASKSLVRTYLNHRGIFCNIPPSIRFLSKHAHRPSQQSFPVMLAKVTDAAGQEIIGVHRTYLSSDGLNKAPVLPHKMSLGLIRGGSVHLVEPGHQLAIAEGIETALSIYQATGLPTWAALSAGGIQNLVLPALPVAYEVIICADYDKVGLQAAYQAAARWRKEGRTVKIAKPLQMGLDFNDVLLGKAICNE